MTTPYIENLKIVHLILSHNLKMQSNFFNENGTQSRLPLKKLHELPKAEKDVRDKDKFR
jgi:hypothetical protein